MEIAVTGRHVQISDRFREHLDDKLAKVPQLAPRIQRLDVVVTHEVNPRQAKESDRVEITSYVKGSVIRAEACADDKYAALDVATDKLFERLRRMHDRSRVHRGRHAPESVAHATARTVAEVGGLVTLPGSPGTDSVSSTADGDGTATATGTADPAAAVDTSAEASSGSIAASGSAADSGSDTGTESDPDSSESLLALIGAVDSPIEVREKTHATSPMSLDQALYEMELVGHDFYLFHCIHTDRPSVVYRRRGWSYGVIRLAVSPSVPADASADADSGAERDTDLNPERDAEPVSSASR